MNVTRSRNDALMKVGPQAVHGRDLQAVRRVVRLVRLESHRGGALVIVSLLLLARVSFAQSSAAPQAPVTAANPASQSEAAALGPETDDHDLVARSRLTV